MSSGPEIKDPLPSAGVPLEPAKLASPNPIKATDVTQITPNKRLLSSALEMRKKMRLADVGGQSCLPPLPLGITEDDMSEDILMIAACIAKATPDDDPLRNCDIVTDEEYLRVRITRLSKLMDVYRRELIHVQRQLKDKKARFRAASRAGASRPRIAGKAYPGWTLSEPDPPGRIEADTAVGGGYPLSRSCTAPLPGGGVCGAQAAPLCTLCLNCILLDPSQCLYHPCPITGRPIQRRAPPVGRGGGGGSATSSPRLKGQGRGAGAGRQGMGPGSPWGGFGGMLQAGVQPPAFSLSMPMPTASSPTATPGAAGAAAAGRQVKLDCGFALSPVPHRQPSAAAGPLSSNAVPSAAGPPNAAAATPAGAVVTADGVADNAGDKGRATAGNPGLLLPAGSAMPPQQQCVAMSAGAGAHGMVLQVPLHGSAVYVPLHDLSVAGAATPSCGGDGSGGEVGTQVTLMGPGCPMVFHALPHHLPTLHPPPAFWAHFDGAARAVTYHTAGPYHLTMAQHPAEPAPPSATAPVPLAAPAVATTPYPPPATSSATAMASAGPTAPAAAGSATWVDSAASRAVPAARPSPATAPPAPAALPATSVVPAAVASASPAVVPSAPSSVALPVTGLPTGAVASPAGGRVMTGSAAGARVLVTSVPPNTTGVPAAQPLLPVVAVETPTLSPAPVPRGSAVASGATLSASSSGLEQGGDKGGGGCNEAETEELVQLVAAIQHARRALLPSLPAAQINGSNMDPGVEAAAAVGAGGDGEWISQEGM